MKNREKYKNELMDVIKMDGRICGFVKKHDVYRMIGTGWESFCEMDCIACGTALQIWLDEEYEVDWSKVPVDTLVRVRNDENGEWLLRYFCEWKVQNSVTGNKMEEAVVELLEEQERLKTLAGEWVELKKSVLAEMEPLPPLYRERRMDSL